LEGNLGEKLTGARYVVYSVIRKSDGAISYHQILKKTGYKRIATVACTVNWLHANGYINRYGTGNGVPYRYEVKNVLDSK
jgi:Fe2+ or Zn2+ uptake regulation protein